MTRRDYEKLAMLIALYLVGFVQGVLAAVTTPGVCK